VIQKSMSLTYQPASEQVAALDGKLAADLSSSATSAKVDAILGNVALGPSSVPLLSLLSSYASILGDI